MSDDDECTCYPGSCTPGTYEGPMPWCDEHGQPSVAYDEGWASACRNILSLIGAGATAAEIVEIVESYPATQEDRKPIWPQS